MSKESQFFVFGSLFDYCESMIIFENEDELEKVDLSKICDVSYGYKNDFSPVHILRDIEAHLN